MKKILSFIRMDLLSLRPFKTSCFTLCLLGVIEAFSMGSLGTPLAASFCVSPLLMFCNVGLTFAACERNSGDILYAVLPLRRVDVVYGRYLFAVLAGVLIILASTALFLAVAFVNGNNIMPKAIALYAAIGFLLYALTVSVQLPLFFKYGYAQSVAAMYAVLSLFATMGMYFAVSYEENGLRMGASIGTNNIYGLNGLTSPLLPCALMLTAAAACLYFSVKLARKIYTRKEI